MLSTLIPSFKRRSIIFSTVPLSGLKEGDVVVAEGLKKVRPNGKIKPIKDGEKKSDSSWGKKENKSK